MCLRKAECTPGSATGRRCGGAVCTSWSISRTSKCLQCKKEKPHTKNPKAAPCKITVRGLTHPTKSCFFADSGRPARGQI